MTADLGPWAPWTLTWDRPPRAPWTLTTGLGPWAPWMLGPWHPLRGHGGTLASRARTPPPPFPPEQNTSAVDAGGKGPWAHPGEGVGGRWGRTKQNKTYSTQDSQIVTDSNTNCAYGCLSCPDRTREAVFTRQWPYVLWSHGFVVHVAGGSHAPGVHEGGGRAPHHPLRLVQAWGHGSLPEQRRGRL